MTTSNQDSPPRVRLFVGVTIDVAPALERILLRLGEMGKPVRTVRKEQLHVTLKFYGDVEDSRVPEIATALNDAILARDAFDWVLRGIGAFPSPARPSVVWAGAEDDGRFARFAEGIERFSEFLGFVRERRSFHPHVTLARIKFRPPPALDELVRETADEEFGQQHAKEVVLFRSDLSPGGSAYTRLHVVELK